MLQRVVANLPAMSLSLVRDGRISTRRHTLLEGAARAGYKEFVGSRAQPPFCPIPRTGELSCAHATRGAEESVTAIRFTDATHVPPIALSGKRQQTVVRSEERRVGKEWRRGG